MKEEIFRQIQRSLFARCQAKKYIRRDSSSSSLGVNSIMAVTEAVSRYLEPSSLFLTAVLNVYAIILRDVRGLPFFSPMLYYFQTTKSQGLIAIFIQY